MRGAIFIETLKRSVWQMVYWGLGLGAMAVFVVGFAPMFNAIDFVGMLEQMPPFLVKSLGVGDDISVLGTPEGMIAFGFFGKMALIFVVYPVVMGLRATSNDEAEGILDIVLSMPVQRTSILIEKFAAYLVTVLIIGMMITAGFALGTSLVDMDLDTGLLVTISLNLIPTLIFVLAFTILVGAIVGRKRLALGIITGFIIGSFMLQSIGGMLDGTTGEVIEGLSFFTYNSAASVLSSGVNMLHISGMLVLAVLMMGVSLVAFERRDVGV